MKKASSLIMEIWSRDVLINERIVIKIHSITMIDRNHLPSAGSMTDQDLAVVAPFNTPTSNMQTLTSMHQQHTTNLTQSAWQTTPRRSLRVDTTSNLLLVLKLIEQIAKLIRLPIRNIGRARIYKHTI